MKSTNVCLLLFVLQACLPEQKTLFTFTKNRSLFRTSVGRCEYNVQLVLKHLSIFLFQLWINRITAASQEHGLKYPAFIANLIKVRLRMWPCQDVDCLWRPAQLAWPRSTAAQCWHLNTAFVLWVFWQMRGLPTLACPYPGGRIGNEQDTNTGVSPIKGKRQKNLALTLKFNFTVFTLNEF